MIKQKIVLFLHVCTYIWFNKFFVKIEQTKQSKPHLFDSDLYLKVN